MKKILTNALFLAVIIVLIAFIPDGWARIASWLVPPRIYILIGIVLLILLWKILLELRKRNNGDDDE